ncbi:MAG: tetratricopeptide repeat protein [Alphaproteobacteria bacterium]
MGDFAGRVVTLLGRLASISKRQAIGEVTRRGGEVRRGLTRRSNLLVVGQGAARLIESGALAARLERADRWGVECISEAAFLRMMGAAADVPGDNRTMSAAEIASRTGLDAATLRLLSLFDVIEPVEGAYGFRDLVAARETARLLTDGATLHQIIASVPTLRHGKRSAESHPLARVKLGRSESGAIVIRVGGGTADLDGQLRLPLGDPGNPTADDHFEAAEEAESEGDWVAAEVLYQRFLDLERSDATARFNLANVLRELGRPQEAEASLKEALAYDPNFAEAWYNLADLAENADDVATAKAYLEKALDLDEDYADAVFNLAQINAREGDFEAAIRHWERYLELDPDSEWSRRARQHLALCRRCLMAASGAKA